MLGINGLVFSGFGRGIALSVLANFWSYEQGLPQETNTNRFGVFGSEAGDAPSCPDAGAENV